MTEQLSTKGSWLFSTRYGRICGLLSMKFQGIKRCARNPSLLLEKIEILKTTRPDEVEALWREVLRI